MGNVMLAQGHLAVTAAEARTAPGKALLWATEPLHPVAT